VAASPTRHASPMASPPPLVTKPSTQRGISSTRPPTSPSQPRFSSPKGQPPPATTGPASSKRPMSPSATSSNSTSTVASPRRQLPSQSSSVAKRQPTPALRQPTPANRQPTPANRQPTSANRHPTPADNKRTVSRTWSEPPQRGLKVNPAKKRNSKSLSELPLDVRTIQEPLSDLQESPAST
jgi:hypothetical protein